MFYNDQGVVRLTATGAAVCGVDEIPRALQELRFLFDAHHQDVDRFTEEGIDRQFKAPANFIPNKELWAHDAASHWLGVDGPELFRRYPLHAESYVWGCNEYGIDPSFEGFRVWLINLRDAEASGGW